MKVRCREHELRFRLNRKDVEQFQREGQCVLAVHQMFSFTLRVGPQWRVDVDGPHLIVDIAQRELMDWLSTEQISLSYSESSVSILIEKDLKCTAPRRQCEDAENAFDWPETLKGHTHE